MECCGGERRHIPVELHAVNSFIGRFREERSISLVKESGGPKSSICRISMYPNVMNYLNYLKKDKVKMLRILERIIEE